MGYIKAFGMYPMAVRMIGEFQAGYKIWLR